MSKPYAITNEVQSTLASAWTRQDQSEQSDVVLTSAADFDSGGGYARIGGRESFALVEYTGITTNTLTGVIACTLGVVVSSADTEKEWPALTTVKRSAVAEDLQDTRNFQDYGLSPMVITGCEISEGTNAGTYKISAGTLAFRDTELDPTSPLHLNSITEQDNQAITAADTTYFVVLSYDGDSTPTVSLAVTYAGDNRQIQLGNVRKDASDNVHFNNGGFRFQNAALKLSRRNRDINKLILASGCTIAWQATNELTMAAGVAYVGIERHTPFSAGAYDSSVGKFTYCWRISDVWQYTADSTVISNLYYDDNTDGTGHPGGDLANKAYGVHWVYLHPDDEHVYIVYGRDSYSLAEANLANPPGDLPPLISDFGILIGKIILQEGKTDAFDAVQMSTDTEFVGSGASSHSSLSGLTEGDDHTQYTLKSLWDAYTLIMATSDDTPIALTVPEQTLVGRITAGTIDALTATEVRTLIGVADGADVTGDNAPQAHKDSHDPEDGGDALDTAAAAEISAVVAAGVGTSSSLARADHIHAIIHAITDNHIVTIDGSPNDDEFARFTAAGLEGLTVAEAITALLGAALPENTSIQLDPALSADGKYSGITETGTAGATLAFGDLCYFAVADSRWELADATVVATSKGRLGICVLAATGDAEATTMLTYGKVRADTAFPTFTIGAPVFVSETAGDATSTIPTKATDVVVRIIGEAVTGNVLFFKPDGAYVEYV